MSRKIHKKLLQQFLSIRKLENGGRRITFHFIPNSRLFFNKQTAHNFNYLILRSKPISLESSSWWNQQNPLRKDAESCVWDLNAYVYSSSRGKSPPPANTSDLKDASSWASFLEKNEDFRVKFTELDFATISCRPVAVHLSGPASSFLKTNCYTCLLLWWLNEMVQVRYLKTWYVASI